MACCMTGYDSAIIHTRYRTEICRGTSPVAWQLLLKKRGDFVSKTQEQKKKRSQNAMHSTFRRVYCLVKIITTFLSLAATAYRPHGLSATCRTGAGVDASGFGEMCTAAM